MFRLLSTSLPKDPEFPADLEKLGYVLLTSNMAPTEFPQVLHQ